MSSASGAPASSRSFFDNVGRLVFPAIALSIFILALYFLHRELAHVSWNDVVTQMRAVSSGRLLAAVALTACSYLILTGYDRLALVYVNRKLPYQQVALTAFMAYAVGQNVGVSTLSGGSIRYRVYSQLGLSSFEIAKVIAFCTSTFAIGSVLLIGIALWTMPTRDLQVLPISTGWQHAAGTGLILLPLVYLVVAFTRCRPFALGNWSIAMPTGRVAGAQVAVATADLMCAASALYVLLEPQLSISFFEFVGIYLIALAAGVISSVPGGVGVIESVLILALPAVDRAALLGSILLFRLIYYVAPLTLAILLLSYRELRQVEGHIRHIGAAAFDSMSRIVPAAVGSLVFLGGIVLLLSGATPAVDSRLALLGEWLHPVFLELSHLLGSLLGVGLLIISRGLFRRLHYAFIAALFALLTGAITALTKGFDYEEASVLLLIALSLWVSRKEFYRGGSLFDLRFTSPWLVSIAMVAGITIWLMMLSFRHVEYANQLWWQFSLNAEAPRALRATLLAAVAVGIFALRKALRPAPPSAAPIDATARTQIQAAIALATNPIANVALLGDKRILFSDTRDAFIMYQLSGRSWIALGDPVGPRGRWEELIWNFRELADRYDSRPAFYQVTSDELSLYVDAGFTLAKLGESAQIDLDDFSLNGSQRASLRQAHNRGLRDGAISEVVSRERVPCILDELAAVSDNWLLDKSTHEKGFSLGAFDRVYVSNFDCMVVRVNDRIVAFANLWRTPAVNELSLDLMRFRNDAPKGIMDFLFIETILWGQQQGFARFDLGMAPLSGLETHPLAPLWHKIGHLIYQHGESFYNFEGLRGYKEKFDPQWEPRYLAAPSGRQMPAVLMDTSILIAGGVRELFAR